MPKNKQIEEALERFDPISIEQMKAIRLMDRIDTKFIAPMDRVFSILEKAEKDYFVQEIDDLNNGGKCRLCSYQTLYYDTPAHDMYILHHNRHLKRQKIRSRVYVESNLYFIEVKNKSNKGRTTKERIEITPEAFWNVTSDAEALEYLRDRSLFPADSLTPALMTQFDRITLVNKALTERITIDQNLCFTNMRTGVSVRTPQLAILELKRDGRAESEMVTILNELRVKNHKISKYCVGVAMTDSEIKKNRFKPKIRIINKITPLNYDTK